MIHFFDKVYLSYAEASVGADAIDRTSESFIQIVDKGLVYLENPIHSKKRLFYNQNVKAFMGNFSSDEDLFQDLTLRLNSGQSKKIMIYVDEHAMMELLIKWWKALFPRITARGIYALYVNYGDHQTIQNSHSRTYLDLTVDTAQINFSKFSHLYWDSSFEKIQGLFELYPAFEISEEIKSRCGIEYKIMNFLVEERPVYLPSLIETMNNLYQKKVVDEITGIKRMIERSLFHMHEHFEASELLLNGQSIKHPLQKHEFLKFILDEKIENTKSSFEYLVNNYDLNKLAQNLISIDHYLHHRSTPETSAALLDNPCLAQICLSGTKVDYIDILNKEINGESSLQLFKRMIQKKRMNPFLVPAFNNLLNHKPKNQELISEFSFGAA